MDEMNRHPVFKALYKPVNYIGVPLPAILFETLFVILFVATKLYVGIIVIALFHFALAIAIKSDPFILPILFDLINTDKDGQNDKV